MEHGELDCEINAPLLREPLKPGLDVGAEQESARSFDSAELIHHRHPNSRVIAEASALRHCRTARQFELCRKKVAS
jgi:hypothetical protein